MQEGTQAQNTGTPEGHFRGEIGAPIWALHSGARHTSSGVARTGAGPSVHVLLRAPGVGEAFW